LIFAVDLTVPVWLRFGPLGHTAHSNMKTDKPFKKSFACAGVLYAIIVIILIVANAQNLSFRLGYVFTTCLFAALASGAWGFFSKKSWSWSRFAVTVLVFYFVFAFLSAFGNGHS
jgi:hypothetical protein